MAPGEIRKATLRELRQAFVKMTSPEWDLALIGKPKEVEDQAAKMLLAVHRARLRLENTELAQIRDKLLANEEALERGRQDVRKALKRLKEIEAVLGAVSSFLGVIGRVVAFV